MGFSFLRKYDFAGDPEPPVSDPFHTYAVSDTSFIVYRGCFHDPSSLERIPQDWDSGIESLPESICRAGDQWCTCPHFILDLLYLLV